MCELTGKNLEGPGEEEASTFLQSEELAEEEEERQAAEDDGEDHQSLDRLDPLCRRGRKRRALSGSDRQSSSSPSSVHNADFNQGEHGGEEMETWKTTTTNAKVCADASRLRRVRASSLREHNELASGHVYFWECVMDP